MGSKTTPIILRPIKYHRTERLADPAGMCKPSACPVRQATILWAYTKLTSLCWMSLGTELRPHSNKILPWTQRPRYPCRSSPSRTKRGLFDASRGIDQMIWGGAAIFDLKRRRKPGSHRIRSNIAEPQQKQQYITILDFGPRMSYDIIDLLDTSSFDCR